VDAHPEAPCVLDNHGLLPIHWLCANGAVCQETLFALLELHPPSATLPDRHGQLALHALCDNAAADEETIQQLLDANPDAAKTADANGCLPIHFLVKSHPDAGQLWQLLLRAGGEEAAAAVSSGSNQAAPVLVNATGELQGVRGRVKDIVKNAADTKGSRQGCRPEDRGLLLFLTSASVVKVTYDACRRASALLENHGMTFEVRDVMISPQYATQIRRLCGATGKGAPAPELPLVFVNGVRLGDLDELARLNDDEQLDKELAEFRTGLGGAAAQENACDACNATRFVVCETCNGSRRGREVFGKVMKCAFCNENGLMPCPNCNFEHDDEYVNAPKNEVANAAAYN
jgi:hypothetical protein